MSENSAEQVNTAKHAAYKIRHILIVMSFVLGVVTPIFLTGYYLQERARDQYISNLAFIVRTESMSSAIDLFGGLKALGSSKASDTDILYAYINSSAIVEEINNQLDLYQIFGSKYQQDPVFSMDPDGSLEDLVRYWQKIVKVSYDRASGLIEVRVYAFSPKDAKLIASEILTRSSKIINDLNSVSREDSIKYSREELNHSVERLKQSRAALARFRSENEFIDPNYEISLQQGQISGLQSTLSELLVERDFLNNYAGTSDPRLIEINRRIEIVQQRIANEREKYFSAEAQGSDFGKLVGEYENLLVDREYAEQAYLAALTAYDNAMLQAQRQSRYLAAYVQPTLPQSSEAPNRDLILLVIAVGLGFVWISCVLVFYAIKDRR